MKKVNMLLTVSTLNNHYFSTKQTDALARLLQFPQTILMASIGKNGHVILTIEEHIETEEQ